MENDKITVMLVLSGNSDTYGDIVHRYKNVIYSVIYSIVKNHHTTEDLTQETFINGYIKLGSLEDPCKLSTWLIKIAKNKCYNYLTRSAIRYENELHDHIPDALSSAPDTFLIEKQERESLRRAVNRLPDLLRTVTQLYYFHNYPQSKIAELLNIPLGTVSRRLYDARLKLRKEFGIMDFNFEKEVSAKVKTIQNYYRLHNNSYDGFDNEFNSVVNLIDKLPDSKTKHAAYADVYMVASWQDEGKRDRALQEAELGENAQVIANILFDKYINDNDVYIDKASEMLNKMKTMPDSNNAIGELMFWRGSRKFIKGWENDNTDYLNESKMDFIEAEKHLDKINSYYPNSIAGIKAVDIETSDRENHTKFSYGITGERYRYENGKMIFAQQPGLSSLTSSA